MTQTTTTTTQPYSVLSTSSKTQPEPVQTTETPVFEPVTMIVRDSLSLSILLFWLKSENSFLAMEITFGLFRMIFNFWGNVFSIPTNEFGTEQTFQVTIADLISLLEVVLPDKPSDSFPVYFDTVASELNTEIRAICGKKVFKIPATIQDGSLPLPLIPEQFSFPKNLLNMLEDILPFGTQEVSRFALNGVCLVKAQVSDSKRDIVKDDIYAVATNGHFLGYQGHASTFAWEKYLANIFQANAENTVVKEMCLPTYKIAQTKEEKEKEKIAKEIEKSNLDKVKNQLLFSRNTVNLFSKIRTALAKKDPRYTFGIGTGAHNTGKHMFVSVFSYLGTDELFSFSTSFLSGQFPSFTMVIPTISDMYFSEVDRLPLQVFLTGAFKDFKAVKEPKQRKNDKRILSIKFELISMTRDLKVSYLLKNQEFSETFQLHYSHIADDISVTFDCELLLTFLKSLPKCGNKSKIGFYLKNKDTQGLFNSNDSEVQVVIMPMRN